MARGTCSRWAPLAVLGLAVVAVFHAALFTRGVFFERDLGNLWYPRVASLVRAVGEGAWPIWDPYPGFGVSAIADPSYQLLYPPTWLNLVIPAGVFLKLSVVAHVLWASLGMRVLLRRLGVGDMAATTAAAAWGACGPWLSLLGHYHHAASAAWAPWTLAALLRFLDESDWRAAVRLALTAGMQMLAGSADMCFFTAAVAPCVVVAASGGRTRGPRSDWVRRGLLLVGAGALACALAAAQWLPTGLQIVGSYRAAFPKDVSTYWSLHPLSLVDVVAPMVVADAPLSNTWRAAVSESREPLLRSLYLGASSLPLVAFGLLTCRRRVGWALGAGLLICLLAALGRHAGLYGLLLRLPLLGFFRYPAKWMVPASLLWFALLALGLDAARAPRGEGRRARPWIAVGIGLALALLMALAAGAAQREWFAYLLADGLPVSVRAAQQSIIAGKLATSAGLAAIVSGLLAATTLQPHRARLWAVTIAGVALVDMAWAGQSVNRLAPAELLTYRPRLLQQIAPDTASYRIFSAPYRDARPEVLRAHGPAGWGPEAAWALAQVDAVRPMTYGRFGVFSSFDGDPTGLLAPEVVVLTGLAQRTSDEWVLLRVLRLANVRYVVGLADERFNFLRRAGCWDSVPALPFCVWEVSDPVPRTYFAGRAHSVAGWDAAQRVADRGFDVAREIVVDVPLPAGLDQSGSQGIARTLGRRADYVEIETSSDGAGFLVLTDAYDPGWRAVVDGRPAPILRANLLFRAVAVPVGSHRVAFSFRPPALAWGLALSGLGLTVVLLSAPWSGRGTVGRGGDA